MRTNDVGFVVGEKATPESFNVWAKTGEIVDVIEVEPWSMKIQRPDGSTEHVHPFRWKKAATLLAKDKHMNHQLYTAAEALAEGGENSALYRNVGDGGLAVCKVCGCYEGSLATNCPGAAVSADQQDRIYNGEVDFVEGQWVEKVATKGGQHASV